MTLLASNRLYMVTALLTNAPNGSESYQQIIIFYDGLSIIITIVAA
jgi:hypothetical protein